MKAVLLCTCKMEVRRASLPTDNLAGHLQLADAELSEEVVPRTCRTEVRRA